MSDDDFVCTEDCHNCDDYAGEVLSLQETITDLRAENKRLLSERVFAEAEVADLRAEVAAQAETIKSLEIHTDLMHQRDATLTRERDGLQERLRLIRTAYAEWYDNGGSASVVLSIMNDLAHAALPAEVKPPITEEPESQG